MKIPTDIESSEPIGASRILSVMKIRLNPGERRGYWKMHMPQEWKCQSQVVASVNDQKAKCLFDSGAEVSIIDSSYARKLALEIDASRTLECTGVGGSPFWTEGFTTIKITLANYLAYGFSLWVGPIQDHDLILGMDFMVPAGVRLNIADGSACLPDEVRVRFEGRK